jgi:conjugative relaxase-like TrwC/TraI family protein
MLSIGKVTGGMLEDYYQKDNYYQEESGPEVVGSGRDIFGLTDKKFTQEKFEHLLQVRERAKDSNARLAMDLTFSAPKSVSLSAMLAPKEVKDKIHKAHDDAVKETLRYVESSGMFQTRIKENGKHTIYTGQGMTVALFKHDLNRNSEPNLHTHSLIANIAIGPDGNIRHADYGQVYANKIRLGGIYRANFEKNLKKEGVKTELSSKKKAFFEIAGFTKKQLEKFSSRYKEIKQNLEASSKKGGKAAALAALQTRSKKEVPVDRSKLIKDIKKQADNVGINFTKIFKGHQSVAVSIKKKVSDIATHRNTKKIISEAIRNLEDSKAVFTKNDIVAESAKVSIQRNKGVDSKKVESLTTDQQKKYGLVVLPGQKGRDAMTQRFTTKELLAIEKDLLKKVKTGKNRLPKLVDFVDAKIHKNQKIKQVINSSKKMVGGGKKFFSLNRQQKDAAKMILSTKDFVTAVQGDAGTGKTSMLKLVKEIAADHNIPVFGVSTSAAAAKNLQNDTGIWSKTIASLTYGHEKKFGKIKNINPISEYDRKIKARSMKNYKRAALKTDSPYLPYQPGILIVDEASFVNSRDMQKLLNVAAARNLRVVLVGDQKQLQAIGAGKPFEMFMRRAKVRTEKLLNIVRQTNLKLLSAVEKTAEGKPQEALDSLISSGYVKEIKDDRERRTAISREYVGDVKNGKNSLIIASTNKERELLNREARYQLKKHGLLEKKDFEIKVKTRQGTSFKKFSVRDKIQFTDNNKKLGVNNSEVGTIAKITKNPFTKNSYTLYVRVGFGKTIKVNTDNFNNFDHGHAVTTYKSQGQSVDKAIYSAPSKKSIVTFNDFYVGISRAKTELSVYTDSLSGLRDKVWRKQIKLSALEEYEKAKSAQIKNRVRSVVDFVKKVAVGGDIRHPSVTDLGKISGKSNTPQIQQAPLHKQEKTEAVPPGKPGFEKKAENQVKNVEKSELDREQVKELENAMECVGYSFFEDRERMAEVARGDEMELSRSEVTPDLQEGTNSAENYGQDKELSGELENAIDCVKYSFFEDRERMEEVARGENEESGFVEQKNAEGGQESEPDGAEQEVGE